MSGMRWMVTAAAIGLLGFPTEGHALWPWGSTHATAFYPTATPVYSANYYQPYAYSANYSQPYAAGYAPYVASYQPYGAGYVGTSSYAVGYRPPIAPPRVVGYWPQSAHTAWYSPAPTTAYYPTAAYALRPPIESYANYGTAAAGYGVTTYAPLNNGPSTAGVAYAAPGCSCNGTATYLAPPSTLSGSASPTVTYGAAPATNLPPSSSSSTLRGMPGSTAPSLLQSPTPADGGAARSRPESSADPAESDESDESRLRPLIDRTFEDGSSTRPAAVPRRLDDRDLTAARPIRRAATAKPALPSQAWSERSAADDAEPTKWRSAARR